MCTGLEPILLGLGAPAAGVGALATSVGTGLASFAGQAVLGKQADAKANKAQEAATAAAKATADAAAKATADATAKADQAFNKANPKQPGYQGLYQDNVDAAKGGVSGTLLTGPQGIDPKTLLLGKATLMGA